MIVETDHPLAGHIKMIGSALKLSELPGEVRLPPTLGQDTDEILRELGLHEAGGSE